MPPTICNTIFCIAITWGNDTQNVLGNDSVYHFINHFFFTSMIFCKCRKDCYRTFC